MNATAIDLGLSLSRPKVFAARSIGIHEQQERREADEAIAKSLFCRRGQAPLRVDIIPCRAGRVAWDSVPIHPTRERVDARAHPRAARQAQRGGPSRRSTP